jgi:NADPH:quinone reductase-like Zn-dependent oxidoreductase
LERRRTVSGGEVESNTNDVRGDAPLAFTGHRGPPGYVDSGSVLVQVWAVGIDGMDEMLVGGKGKEKADVGFIPGRSFVGRVLECGGDVKDVDARKGEWVMGLMDIRKVSLYTRIYFKVSWLITF